MSQQLSLLTQKIKQLSNNIDLVKNLIDKDEGICNEMHKIDKVNMLLFQAIQNISTLSNQIAKLFEKGSFKSEQLKVQKFQKDYVAKMNSYRKLLLQYQKRKQSELSDYRQTYSARDTGLRQGLVKNRTRQDTYQDESEQGPQIQLQDVNQDTLFYQHMIQLKQKELQQVKSKMENALSAQKQVQRLVIQQGGQIDIIEDNVDQALENVIEAEKNLKEGQKHHMSANKKKMIIFAVVFILLLIIIIPILIKFL